MDGSNVAILKGVRIGRGAIIAAGVIVNHDIPPYAIAGGVPVKVSKYHFLRRKLLNMNLFYILRSERLLNKNDRGLILYIIEKVKFKIQGSSIV